MHLYKQRCIEQTEFIVLEYKTTVTVLLNILMYD